MDERSHLYCSEHNPPIPFDARVQGSGAAQHEKGGSMLANAVSNSANNMAAHGFFHDAVDAEL